jgi:hypothetical protein
MVTYLPDLGESLWPGSREWQRKNAKNQDKGFCRLQGAVRQAIPLPQPS